MSTSDTTNALLTGDDQLATWLTTGKGGTVEGGFAYPRGSLYGEAMVQNLHGTRIPMLGREGSYWCASNTLGTAITGQNVAAFGATTPALILFNGNSVGSNKYIYPTRFQCSVVAVGTTSSNWDSQWLVDTGNRLSSGGTALTPKSPNLNVLNTATGAVVTMGAPTGTAANASRVVSVMRVRTVIKVAGDRYEVQFGQSVPAATGMPLEGTTQLHTIHQVPSIAIPPQCSLLWYEYGASQAAASSFDSIQLEWVER
jgi:hypothetical protein